MDVAHLKIKNVNGILLVGHAVHLSRTRVSAMSNSSVLTLYF